MPKRGQKTWYKRLFETHDKEHLLCHFRALSVKCAGSKAAERTFAPEMDALFETILSRMSR